jgi:hypothetical protein
MLTATAGVADTWRMTRRLATVVLAGAAAGSLGVATVRIAGANQRHQGDYEKHVRIYGTTPALAAATLASLHRPPGFRHCQGQKSPEWACLSRTPSLPLGEASMRQLLTEIGVRPYSTWQASYHEGPLAIECHPFHVFPKYGLGLQVCQAEALKGRDRLLIFAHSFVLPSGKPTRRWIKSWRFPTEVTIAVVGHFEHEGLTPAEEAE